MCFVDQVKVWTSWCRPATGKGEFGGEKLGAKAGFVSHLVVGRLLKFCAFVSPSPLLNNGHLQAVAVTEASLSFVTDTAEDNLCRGWEKTVVLDSSLSINEPRSMWLFVSLPLSRQLARLVLFERRVVSEAGIGVV